MLKLKTTQNITDEKPTFAINSSYSPLKTAITPATTVYNRPRCLACHIVIRCARITTHAIPGKGPTEWQTLKTIVNHLQ